MPPASQIAWIAVTSGREVGPEDADVDAGSDAARLERGGHGPGFVVELAPRHPVGSFAGGRRPHEGDRAAALRGSFETRGDGSHSGFDSCPTKGLPAGGRPVGRAQTRFGSIVIRVGEGGRMTPATVVLVHGMGGSPAMWSRVIPLLDELGVPNVAVQLPSGLPESATDDAACVRSLLDELVDPVVLVGHSMGGMVVTEVGISSA